jgi:acyl-coenzyme A thioesterase PaaI-like protein
MPITKPSPNPLRKFAERALSYPHWIGMRLLTFVFRYKVKLVGTTKLQILDTDLQTVTFFVKNRTKVRNHIGQVHAATMALLAESATGFVVGINLPGDKLPLIKSMDLKYVRRSEGDMTAVARVTDTQIEIMQSQDKGDIIVDVVVSDESGEEPIICQMNWAWVTKRS